MKHKQKHLTKRTGKQLAATLHLFVTQQTPLGQAPHERTTPL